MATKAFDHPHLLPLLVEKTRKWQTLANTETQWALMGYIFYCSEDFKQAQKCFLKTLQINPRNLDNWFDLAFSLYHQGQEKHELAKKIIFNFDWCARFFAKKKLTLQILKKSLKGAL